jgi:hypothetical protein
MRKVTMILGALLAFALTGCSHNPSDVKSTNNQKETKYYSDVKLDWDASSFTVDEYTIAIPEKWGLGINGKKEIFEKYNPHDIIFKYILTTTITYGGVEDVVASFDELEKKNPKEQTRIFELNVSNIDIDSKILVKDELRDDLYFKYDFAENFNNYCYFKISKNDVSQLKSKKYNQINVKLKYYEHIDSTYSFIYNEEKDGLNNIGYYSDVSIINNPDL